MSTTTTQYLSSNANNVWALNPTAWSALSQTRDTDLGTGLAVSTNAAQNEQLFSLTNTDIADPITTLKIYLASKVFIGPSVAVVVNVYPGGYQIGTSPALTFTVPCTTVAIEHVVSANTNISVADFNNAQIGLSVPSYIKSSHAFWLLCTFKLEITQSTATLVVDPESYIQFDTAHPGEMPIYNLPIYVDREAMLKPLGSFWNTLYHGQEQLSQLILSRGMLAWEQEKLVSEAEHCVSRHSVPVFSSPLWKPLVLKESAKNNTVVSARRYGQGETYGDGLVYGRSVFERRTQFLVPSDLADIPTLSNRIADPSVILVHGIDYVFDRETSTITFRYDPFGNPNNVIDNQYYNNEIVDRSITLWMHLPSEDKRYVEQLYGYAVSIYGESSDFYKQAVSAVLDCLVGGTTASSLESLLSAAFGVPLAKSNETVQYVLKDSDQLKIVTDKQVYFFSRYAEAAVQQGDAVSAGQSFVTGFGIYYLNRNEIPAIDGLCIGSELSGGRYASDLFFANEEVPLDAFELAGKTRFRFAISGWPADVDAFWDDVYAKEDELDVSFAAAMDVRTDKSTPTQPNHLPKTINPMRFLIDNALQNNTTILLLDSGLISSFSPGLQTLSQVRKLLSPYTALLLVVRLPLTEDPGTIGFDQVNDVQSSLELIAETSPVPQERMHYLRELSGTCQ